MVKNSSYINIEDVLFSAIIGAYLSTFIDKLDYYYILVLIIFFVMFPFSLKYFEHKSKYLLVTITLIGLLVLTIFTYHLVNINVIDNKNFINFIVVFLGWVISINMRLFIPIIDREKQRENRIEIETLAIQNQNIKGIILLVGDFSRKVSRESYDIEQELIFRLIEKLTKENQNMKYVWLVHQDIRESKGSPSYVARLIRDKYKDKFKEVIRKPIDDPFNTQNTYDVVSDIYTEATKKFSLKEEEIACDCTGGTKTMSIGASLACSSRSRKLVYCTKKENGDTLLHINKAIMNN